MDADGKNVRRLTHDVGYDGGAVFDADCTHIVWRASRPKPGKELDDYKRLLAQNLVRPSKLELYVADADGSDAHQVTYLDAASFGPAFMPGGQAASIFASNYGDPRGREFDLWAIDVAGTRLERITDAPGLRRLPAVLARRQAAGVRVEPRHARRARTTPTCSSPTGSPRRRARPAGAHEPNAPADRILADMRWLADPAARGARHRHRRAGGGGRVHRGALQAAGPRAGRRRRRLPAGVPGAHRPEGRARDRAAPRRARLSRATRSSRSGFSATGKAVGPLVLAGLRPASTRSSASTTTPGSTCAARSSSCAASSPSTPSLSTPERAAARRRPAPEGLARARARRARRCWSSICRRARRTRPPTGSRRRAAAVAAAPERLRRRRASRCCWSSARRWRPSSSKLDEEAARRRRRSRSRSATRRKQAFNVVGRLPRAGRRRRGRRAWSSIGAHYDHLGLGEHHSLAPDSHLPHLGADDNASGTATVLEIARQLRPGRDALARDVVFVAFSGEEEGTLGSTHFTRSAARRPEGRRRARDDQPGHGRPAARQPRDDPGRGVGGGVAGAAGRGVRATRASTARRRRTAASAPATRCRSTRRACPVVHFFTGSHADYHKPSDAADRINAAGAAQIGAAVAALAGARRGAQARRSRSSA